MSTSPIVQIKSLGFTWETLDPFLFCAYHDDAYPQAKADMTPQASLGAASGTRSIACRTRSARLIAKL